MNTADQDLIKTLLHSNLPFFIGRIAGVELQVAYFLKEQKITELAYAIQELENNAGIHVKDTESLHYYIDQLLQAYKHCTHLAIWEQVGPVFAITGKGQEMILERNPTLPRIQARSLEPYYVQNSWMSAMKGKRILIIHPFTTTIKKQLEKRHLLFPTTSWFEDCTFQFVKPPLTLAGNHEGKDWTTSYQACIEELTQLEPFDVALVAAGGYGMLFADYIHTEMKRSVMYIGGALQLFFGIIGKRWFSNTQIMDCVTDDWVRPDALDQPPNFKRVEKGCYW